MKKYTSTKLLLKFSFSLAVIASASIFYSIYKSHYINSKFMILTKINSKLNDLHNIEREFRKKKNIIPVKKFEKESLNMIKLIKIEHFKKMNELYLKYEKQFYEYAKITMETDGNENTGLKGKFRNAVHIVEKIFKENNYIKLNNILLECRRNEKDFLLRKSSVYLDRHKKNYSKLINEVNKIDINNKDIIIKNLKLYKYNFLKLVAIINNVSASKLSPFKKTKLFRFNLEEYIGTYYMLILKQSKSIFIINLLAFISVLLIIIFIFFIINFAINQNNKLLKNKEILEIKVKERTAELEIQKNKFHDFFRKSKNAYLMIIDEKFVDCNIAATELLGYTKKELLDYPENLSPEFQPDGSNSKIKAREHMDEAINKGWARFEWIHLHKDGTPRVIDVTLSIIDRDYEVAISVSWYDITKRKKAENELKDKMLEIIKINKKLENYSYTISHDLKEPIRSIRTFSEFIVEDYNDYFDNEAKDYFSRIIKASSKMALMIDDLLILSRVGRTDIEFKNISIKEIVKEVESILQQKIQETNTIIKLNELPVIFCQPTWVRAIFQNLISNSIKYNDKEEKIIELSYKEINGFYEFSVKDNGNGIEESQFEKIFGLFRKAHQDRNIEGSGAGLAIVSSVIEQHDGKIWVNWSEVTKGTEFKFTISKNLNNLEESNE